MKLYTITLVLLLASLSMLLPLTNPNYELDLIQRTPTSVILDISNPVIKLSSRTTDLVSINVSFIDLSENSTTTVLTTQFIDTTKFNLVKSGFYLFEFYSVSLDKITFDFNGLFLVNILVIALAIVINIVYGSYFYYKEFMR